MGDFKYVDFLDYLVYCCDKPGEYKLVGVITDKQTAVEVRRKTNHDHWDIVEEIHKKIYPQETVEKEKLFPDAIVMFSDGNDFIVDLPKEVSLPQLEAFFEFLKQVRTFEQDIGGTIHMLDSITGLADDAHARLNKDKKPGPDEVIIGEANKTKKRTD